MNLKMNEDPKILYVKWDFCIFDMRNLNIYIF